MAEVVHIERRLTLAELIAMSERDFDAFTQAHPGVVTTLIREDEDDG